MRGVLDMITRAYSHSQIDYAPVPTRPGYVVLIVVGVLVAAPDTPRGRLDQAAICDALHESGVPLAPRLLANATRVATGVEIHPAARIGDHLGRHVKSIDNALQRIKRKLDVHIQERDASELAHA